MKTIEIRTNDGHGGFMEAKRDADAVAVEVLGESVCMSWFNRERNQESPAHASECHGSCEIPGYVEYAETRGATVRVVVDEGAFVFCFRPLGEFADL